MSKIIKSNKFIWQYCELGDVDKTGVDSALRTLIVNPQLAVYQRLYLNPFSLRQIHPNSNKQLTIFFEILPSGDVYLKWMNDYSCLHDTRMSYGDDPCLKELQKYLASPLIENYDASIHLPDFKIDPKYGKHPLFMSMDLLNIKIHISPYEIEGVLVAHAIGLYDLDSLGREDIDDFLDFKEFFNFLSNHFKSKNITKFSLELNNQTTPKNILNLSINSLDNTYWNVIHDRANDYTIIKLK